jgi:sugar/nucleoside kinase (ribokinase family)
MINAGATLLSILARYQLCRTECLVDDVIVALGSVALDTTRTPARTVTGVLGGSGTYFALAASFFHRTGLISVVGRDFPGRFKQILAERVDLEGLTVARGKTFVYDSRFDSDMTKRTTLRTELNVFQSFHPIVPEVYQAARYAYLGNIDPELQLSVLDQIRDPGLVVSDTIDLWISMKREKVIEVMSQMNGVLVNDEEVKLLCGRPNLIKCAEMMLDWGVDFVIVKKGEHGAILTTRDGVFPSPAYPIGDVVDPTGAGDAFAGGFVGAIARKGTTDARTLREAIAYGNVMGSFVVEDFGVNRLLTLTQADIDARYRRYKRLLAF